MLKDINSVAEKLKEIRTYLCKIGPSRRQGEILKTKLYEAKELYLQYSTLKGQIIVLVEKGKIQGEQINLVYNLFSRIDTLFNEITSYCREKPLEKMDTFDLKTALSLLPIMTDNVENTKQLIDNIDYYGSLLTKPECQQNLITFVLKSRLSQAAKLKLASSYTNVKELVRDMTAVLLSQKAATAIQSKLQNSQQNDRSIDDFGRELSELFIDLTISQANGNTDSYEILKPLNEKMAIKKFADGLRNRRLSTIIAARNFSSLKDAIQAAIDEEVTSSPSTSGTIFGINRPKNSNYRGRGNNTRGYNKFNNNMFSQGQSRTFTGRYYQNNNFRGNNRGYNGSGRRGGYRGGYSRSFHGPPRGQGQGQYRGKSNFNHSNRNNQFSRNVNVMTENSASTAENENLNLNQFFRD